MMKKVLFLLLVLVGLSASAQRYVLRDIDWKFMVQDVQYVNDSTWIIRAIPYDYNDPGAATREVGNFVRDNASNPYEIIEYTDSTLTVVDIMFDGYPLSPQQDMPARCYLSLNHGDKLFGSAGAVNDYYLDPSFSWLGQSHNDELLAQAIVAPKDSIIFTLDHQPIQWGEGVVYYDTTKHALTYFNDVADVSVNMGQEVLFRVFNATADTIYNGNVITPSITTVIDLADNRFKNRAIIVAVATHDMPPNTWGWATKSGQVGGLNTSMYFEGQTLFLGINGKFTTDIPVNGYYPTIMGVVDIVSETEGVITVDIIPSLYTTEVNSTNGFPDNQKIVTDLRVDNANRRFFIEPTSSMYHYYMLGNKYEKFAADSVQFPDSEGFHVFFFDRDTLKTIFDPTVADYRDIILDKAYIASIYWNATDNKIEWDIFEERHGIGMSPETHAYLHQTRGARLIGGFGLGDINADASGNLATDAQFSVSAGEFRDEDLIHSLDNTLPVGTTIPVVYISGQNFRTHETTGFAVYGVTGGRLYYNQSIGGVWQLTEVGTGNFVLYHIFAVNGKDKKIVSVMGQNEYSTITEARAGAVNEIADIRVTFESREAIPLATIIYETKTVFANAVKARIRSTDDGSDYIDWRTTEIGQGSPPTSHENLTELYKAGDGVNYGHIDDLTQDIFGDKNFVEGLRLNGDTVATLIDLQSGLDLKQNTADYESTQLEWIQGGKDANSIKLSLFGSYPGGPVPLYKVTEIPIVNSTYDGLMSSEQLDSLRNNSDSIPVLRTDINKNTTDIATLDASAVKTVNSIAPTLGNVDIGLSNLTDYTTTNTITANNFRTQASNSSYSLITRTGSTSTPLYVQQGNPTGIISEFRYNSATAGGGALAFRIKHDEITSNVRLLMSNSILFGGAGTVQWNTGTEFIDGDSNNGNIFTSSRMGTIIKGDNNDNDVATAKMFEVVEGSAENSLFYVRKDGNVNVADNITINGTPTAGSTHAARMIDIDNALDGLGFDGTGTENYLTKFNISGGLTESLLYDNGFNVGLGVLSSIYAGNYLYVNSDLTQARFKLANSTTGSFAADGFEINMIDNNATINNRENGRISFYTKNTERATLANTGNLLIGTTTDNGYKLDVNGTSIFRDYLDIDGLTRITNGSVVGYNGSTYNDLILRASSNVGQLKLFTSGNIGINQSTDNGYKLDVNGTGIFRDNLTVLSSTNNEGITVSRLTGVPAIKLTASTLSNSWIFFGDANNELIGRVGYNNSTDEMRFFTNNAERLNIRSNGDADFLYGATVADAPTDPTDVVRLQELADSAAQLRSEIPTAITYTAGLGMDLVGNRFDMAIQNLTTSTPGTEDWIVWTDEDGGFLFGDHYRMQISDLADLILPNLANVAYNNINNSFTAAQTITTSAYPALSVVGTSNFGAAIDFKATFYSASSTGQISGYNGTLSLQGVTNANIYEQTSGHTVKVTNNGIFANPDYGTATYQLMYDETTDEVFYYEAGSASIPTLQQVTTSGAVSTVGAAFNTDGYTPLVLSNTSGISNSLSILIKDENGGSVGEFGYNNNINKHRMALFVGDYSIWTNSIGGGVDIFTMAKTTGQLNLSQYTSTSSFTLGTPVGMLVFDASGNIGTATIPTSSGSTDLSFSSITSSSFTLVSSTGNNVNFNLSGISASGNASTITLTSTGTGGGNVSSGTYSTGQVAYWTGTNTIGGDADFTFDGTRATITGVQTANIYDLSGNSKIGITTGAGSTITVYDPLRLGNESSDPVGSAGLVYYNTTSGKFRGYEGGAWKDLISTASGSGVSLGSATQIPYMNPAGDDFLYTSNLTYNGSLLATPNITASGTLQGDVMIATTSLDAPYIDVTTVDAVSLNATTASVTTATVFGNITINGTATASNFILSSDRILKKDIEDVNNLDWVDNIQFKQFRMKSDDTYLRYGVVAQEIEMINPELVRRNEDGIYSVAYIDLLIAKAARQDEKIKEQQKEIDILKKGLERIEIMLMKNEK